MQSSRVDKVEVFHAHKKAANATKIRCFSIFDCSGAEEARLHYHVAHLHMGVLTLTVTHVGMIPFALKCTMRVSYPVTSVVLYRDSA